MSGDVVRSILVSSDLSGGSDRVVRAAAELAEQTGAALHVLHAIEVLGRPFWEATFDLIRLQSIVHESRAELHDQLRRVLPPAVSAGSVKLDYQAAPVAILQRAKEVEADLIVVGPHRARMPGGYVLGTTAQRVVEEATVPCLVARGPLASPLRRVLLPVGASDVRRGLLDAGGQWLTMLRRQRDASADREGATELRVLHVVRVPGEWPEFSEEFSRAIDALHHRPGFGTHFSLHRAVAWSKAPAGEILRTAEELAVDLIAMGVHGHGPLMRALLGSVSSEVLRQTSAPVLLVPQRVCERWARASDGGWGHPVAGGPAAESLVAETLAAPRDPRTTSPWADAQPDPDEDEIEPTGAKLTH